MTLTPNGESVRFNVLIIENNRDAANFIASELGRRGCDCKKEIHGHLQEFVAAFDALYPEGAAAGPQYNGTVLDLEFSSHDGRKQRGGGADLFHHLESRGLRRNLGVVLLATEHGDLADDLFRDSDVLWSRKNHPDELSDNLDRFVERMRVESSHRQEGVGLIDH